MSEQIIGHVGEEQKETPQAEQPTEEKTEQSADSTIEEEIVEHYRKRLIWYRFFYVAWWIVTIGIALSMVAWAMIGKWLYVVNNAAWLFIALMRVYDQRSLTNIAGVTLHATSLNINLHRRVYIHHLREEAYEKQARLYEEIIDAYKHKEEEKK